MRDAILGGDQESRKLAYEEPVTVTGPQTQETGDGETHEPIGAILRRGLGSQVIGTCESKAKSRHRGVEFRSIYLLINERYHAGASLYVMGRVLLCIDKGASPHS